LWGLGGMVVVLGIAWLLSVDRRRIRWRTVALALLVQVTFGVLVLFVPVGRRVLTAVSQAVQAVIDSSSAGIDFLFGGILPDEGTVFAFQVLPVIVFFASLTAVLYHVGALQFVTRWIGGALAKVLGTEQAESMNAAANIFVGQTEAPLVIRPYIKDMSPSEVFAVMAGGLTTVAGSVLVGYSLLGANLEYLIAASFMAAPAGLLMAKMLVPAGAMAHIGPHAARSESELSVGSEPSVGGEPSVGSELSAGSGQAAGEGSGHGDRRRGAGTRLAAAFRRGGRRGATMDSRDELLRRARAADAPADGAEGTEEDTDEPPPVNIIDAASRGAADG